jgi:hypothetical protein
MRCGNELGPSREERSQVEDDGDLELAPESIQEMAVEDVSDSRRRAAARDLGVERSDVEGEDVKGRELGQTGDQAVPHLATGAGHEHDGLTRHGNLRQDGTRIGGNPVIAGGP